MSFNYYPDLNRYFQTLYYRNQEWFKYRSALSAQEQRRLFQAFMKMDDGLREVSRVFIQKKAPPRSDAKDREISNPVFSTIREVTSSDNLSTV